MSKYEPSREQLEAFITRAGFRWGWENLESAARRMAEHACIELQAAHLAAQAEWPSEEDVARLFHDEYERLAPSFGYETREDTRVFDANSPNGQLMIAVCRNVRAALQSVRPPVGVVSDEDVRRACTAYVICANPDDDNEPVSYVPARIRAALKSYASRHAPTKD